MALTCACAVGRNRDPRRRVTPWPGSFVARPIVWGHQLAWVWQHELASLPRSLLSPTTESQLITARSIRTWTKWRYSQRRKENETQTKEKRAHRWPAGVMSSAPVVHCCEHGCCQLTTTSYSRCETTGRTSRQRQRRKWRTRFKMRQRYNTKAEIQEAAAALCAVWCSPVPVLPSLGFSYRECRLLVIVVVVVVVIVML